MPILLILRYCIALLAMVLLVSVGAPPEPIRSMSVYAPDITDKTLPSPYFIDLALIKQVRCGNFLGTVAVVGSDKYITADHVIRGNEFRCAIGGSPVMVAEGSHDLDFARLIGNTGEYRKLPVTCAGFTGGQTYFAVGYAYGTDLVVQRLTATDTITTTRDEKGDQNFTMIRILKGHIASGMSGGPIFDDQGMVVGIVNAQGYGGALVYSRELRDTSMCQPRGQSPVASSTGGISIPVAR